MKTLLGGTAGVFQLSDGHLKGLVQGVVHRLLDGVGPVVRKQPEALFNGGPDSIGQLGRQAGFFQKVFGVT